MGDIEARSLGTRKGVSFKAAKIDVLGCDVDLLVVGMFERDGINRPTGGANQIDRALHGTLGRLREGRISKGTMGDTLILSSTPALIKANSLMLIGMGDDPGTLPHSIGELTANAMQTALRMGARSTACLLTWSERELPSNLVELTAEMMMKGVLRAVEGHDGHDRQPEMEWFFDIRNGDAARMADALERALGKPSG